MSFIQLPDQKRSGHLRLSRKRIPISSRSLESDPGSNPSRAERRQFCEEDLSCEISWPKVQGIFEWIVPTQYHHCDMSHDVYHSLFMLYLYCAWLLTIQQHSIKDPDVHGLEHGGTTVIHAVTMILVTEFICRSESAVT
jgi:hypothetical protein